MEIQDANDLPLITNLTQKLQLNRIVALCFISSDYNKPSVAWLSNENKILSSRCVSIDLATIKHPHLFGKEPLTGLVIPTHPLFR